MSTFVSYIIYHLSLAATVVHPSLIWDFQRLISYWECIPLWREVVIEVLPERSLAMGRCRWAPTSPPSWLVR
jgi:hypothetical protein